VIRRLAQRLRFLTERGRSLTSEVEYRHGSRAPRRTMGGGEVVQLVFLSDDRRAIARCVAGATHRLDPSWCPHHARSWPVSDKSQDYGVPLPHRVRARSPGLGRSVRSLSVSRSVDEVNRMEPDSRRRRLTLPIWIWMSKQCARSAMAILSQILCDCRDGGVSSFHFPFWVESGMGPEVRPALLS